MSNSPQTQPDFPTSGSASVRLEKGVVHEAEAQRQHVRVQLPGQLMARTNDEALILEIANISMSGIAFRSATELPIGSVLNARLRFPSAGYALELHAKVRVLSHADGVTSANFEHMEPDARVSLRHLINAYIAGEVVSANELIHVVSRNNTAAPRKQKQASPKGFARALAGTALYALAGLFALAYVLHALYNLVAVSTPLSASVSADAIAVTQPRGGTYDEYAEGDSVSEGQTLGQYRWRQFDGNGIPVEQSGLVISPCNCLIKRRLFSNGALVGQGQTLYELVPADAPLYVDAFFSYADGSRLVTGDRASFASADGVRGAGRIESIKAHEETVAVRIVPDESVDMTDFGKPVAVRVDRWGLMQ